MIFFTLRLGKTCKESVSSVHGWIYNWWINNQLITENIKENKQKKSAWHFRKMQLFRILHTSSLPFHLAALFLKGSAGPGKLLSASGQVLLPGSQLGPYLCQLGFQAAALLRCRSCLLLQRLDPGLHFLDLWALDWEAEWECETAEKCIIDYALKYFWNLIPHVIPNTLKRSEIRIVNPFNLLLYLSVELVKTGIAVWLILTALGL